jgi:exonuclease III
VSWNVNGLDKHKLEDNNFINRLCVHDIIFLYESWCGINSIIEIDGYKCFNFYRKFRSRRAKRFSGGIALYLKDSIANGASIVENHSDSIVWLKLDKQFFRMDEDVFLAGIYLWGEKSPAYNFVNIDFFQVLQNDIALFQKQGRVLLCGDLNARVGNGDRRDYIVCDRVVDFTDDVDYVPDCQLDRTSMDTGFNSHGVKLLDLCKATSLRFANGRLFDDHLVGAFTYCGARGSSVIDYLLLGENDFHCITSFRVHDFSEWSDHAEISFRISCNILRNSNDDDITRNHVRWDSALRNRFRSGVIAMLPDLNHIVTSVDISSRESVNSCVEKFVNVLKNVADPLFCKTSVVKNVRHAYECPPLCNKSDWFDDECRAAKFSYMSARANFNRCRSDSNRVEMCKLRTLYKGLVRNKKRKHERDKVRRIEKMRHAQPREFWKLFTRKKKKQCAISTDEFF